METEVPNLEVDMELERASQGSGTPTENKKDIVEERKNEDYGKQDKIDRSFKRQREEEDNKTWTTVGDNKKHKLEKIELFLTSKDKLPKQFAIAKLLTTAGLHRINKIKYLNPYKLKLEVPNEEYAKNVIDCEEFKRQEWKILRVTDVVMSYGIIRGVDLDLTDEDILRDISGPSDVQIVSAKRLQKRDGDNKWVPSEVARVVFAGSQLPAYVNIDNLRIQVEPFIFPATQCSKCWKFGHTKTRCSSRNVICPKCSGFHENCDIQIFKCVNCKRDHMSLNRSCPVFLREKKLRELMAEFNCTYRVACNMYVEPERHYEIPSKNRISENLPFQLNTQISFAELDQEEINIHKYAPITPTRVVLKIFS